MHSGRFASRPDVARLPASDSRQRLGDAAGGRGERAPPERDTPGLCVADGKLKRDLRCWRLVKTAMRDVEASVIRSKRAAKRRAYDG
jgi:hypothetical protein